MGRQARATWIGEHGRADVTLHLESAGLQISGERRARVPRHSWSQVEAADGVVSFVADGDTYRFRLGSAAPAWASALATPPPSLAEKLGVADGATVAVRGDLPLPELAEALADAARVAPWESDVVLVVVRTDRELELRTVTGASEVNAGEADVADLTANASGAAVGVLLAATPLGRWPAMLERLLTRDA